MRYLNLIWDFDGMLFNTYPRMAMAFQKALEDLGVSEGYDVVMERIKRSVRGAAAACSKEYDLDEKLLTERYQLHEHAMPVDTMIPYEGMCDLLRDTYNAGARHFLYSHRDHSALDALERHGIRALFEGAITWMDHFPAKPAPDAIAHLIREYRLEPSKTLMLGDRDIDILAAGNAGIAGCLFDPEHFYDDLSNPLRAGSTEKLRALLMVK